MNSSELRERGLRALDAVKHCSYQMLPEQYHHDRMMRLIAPIFWTETEVLFSEMIAEQVNSRNLPSGLV